MEHFLTKAGLQTDDPRMCVGSFNDGAAVILIARITCTSIKLLSLATQKFMSDVAQDALQHCKQRQAANPSAKKPGQVRLVCGLCLWHSPLCGGQEKSFVLLTGDLEAALQEYGVNVRKAPYFL